MLILTARCRSFSNQYFEPAEYSFTNDEILLGDTDGLAYKMAATGAIGGIGDRGRDRGRD